jgi:methylated-DNA-[protein]-cysteine S-methyltransferase
MSAHPFSTVRAPSCWQWQQPSPLGPLQLIASDEGLIALSFLQGQVLRQVLPPCRDGAHPHSRAAAQWLQAYWDRQWDHPLPVLANRNATSPWRQQVWQACSSLRAGCLNSYGQLAAVLQRPSACRAVAQALAHNPILLLRPCHRIVGAGGNLGGYAAGLQRKSWLLRHEGLPWPFGEGTQDSKILR